MGCSNGTDILASGAMARPGPFARVARLHPPIPGNPAPVAGLAGRPVLIAAGRTGPMCPWPLGARLIDRVAAQGAAGMTEPHAGGPEIRPAEIAAQARRAA